MSFVWSSEISAPVTRIRPIASHVGYIFAPRAAFDVNPVIWHELVHGGIALRGPAMTDWALDPEGHELAGWVRANLDHYWRPLLHRAGTSTRPLSADRVTWHLLGPARMHATLTTGEVISKDEAGRRAAARFPAHAPILGVALAHLRGEHASAGPPRHEWRGLTVACMRDILAATAELPT